MPARRTTAVAETSLPRRGHGSPIILIALGVLLLVSALLVITLQVQTNQAYLNNTQKVENIVQAQWSIWLQIPKLMFGDVVPGPPLKSSEIPGIIVGQMVELVYLALISSVEIAKYSSQKLGRLAGAIAFILSVIICVFNFLADLGYGDVSPQAHVAFAVFCTLIVGFFPTWGFTLIKHGWSRL